jgi:hypothetical protein
MNRLMAGTFMVVLAGNLAGPSFASAQSPEGLAIVVSAYGVRRSGGETRRGWSVTDAARTGQTQSTTIQHYRPNGCGGAFGAELAATLYHHPSQQSFPVDSAWVIDVTPMRIVDDAVTFKIRWLRARDNGKPSTSPGADVEMTLRPGQSLPLDVIDGLVPTTRNDPCGWSLRVGVERTPEPDHDRRLLGVDLWLIERLADGTERVQSSSLRGQYNTGIPFFFDRIPSSPLSFDLFGELLLVSTPKDKQMTITLKNRVMGLPWPTPQPNDYVDEKRVTTPIALDEVIEVALPRTDEGPGWSPLFANRTLSVRVRVRQLR